MIKQVIPGIRSGTVDIPASKSDAQRAYLAAALANGTSVLTGCGNSDDERAMLEAIARLGARIEQREGTLLITGITAFPETLTLHAGESGLGIRLLTPLCAVFPGTRTITAAGSLTVRPMHFFETVLPQFGAECRSENGHAPLLVSGPMHGAHVEVDGSLSSQFISGLLMALPLAETGSTLFVPRLNSRPYVEMTLQTLQTFGIRVATNGNTFNIPGKQAYRSVTYPIDADWSAAGYWLIAGALGHQLTVCGLNEMSLQADKAVLGFLEAAGCTVQRTKQGIRVDGAAKHAFSVDATDCPDLFPTLVVLAASCVGVSTIKGARRLEHKESHRGLTLQSEFGKLGVRIELTADTLRIHGTGTLRGGVVSAHHDHRIAMSLAIAATIADDSVTIDQAEAVAKSYPAFWETLEALAVS